MHINKLGIKFRELFCAESFFYKAFKILFDNKLFSFLFINLHKEIKLKCLLVK